MDNEEIRQQEYIEAMVEAALAFDDWMPTDLELIQMADEYGEI